MADLLTNHFCREFREDSDFVELDFMVGCGYKQTVRWKA